MKKKDRQAIPNDIAARALFHADRTCCVCRVRGKPVQIHHIDENTANNDIKNLSVLCFDCHRETQISGGFDRKLGPDQVILYRDDWNRLVAHARVPEEPVRSKSFQTRVTVELATSLAEIYLEKKDYVSLAMHYNRIGNQELRDKYIERALEETLHDETIIYLRSLQDKSSLIPEEVALRELDRRANEHDWLQRGRTLEILGRHREAVADYLKGIQECLGEEKIFTTAIYLKELSESGLIDELFVLALKQAKEDNDLWWQARALQELGWKSELDEFLRRNEKEIRGSGNLLFLAMLTRTLGEKDAWLSIRKKIAHHQKIKA
jgi:tetratricopeptide (TPR) repeat protein